MRYTKEDIRILSVLMFPFRLKLKKAQKFVIFEFIDISGENERKKALLVPKGSLMVFFGAVKLRIYSKENP